MGVLWYSTCKRIWPITLSKKHHSSSTSAIGLKISWLWKTIIRQRKKTFRTTSTSTAPRPYLITSTCSASTTFRKVRSCFQETSALPRLNLGTSKYRSSLARRTTRIQISTQNLVLLTRSKRTTLWESTCRLPMWSTRWTSITLVTTCWVPSTPTHA